MQKIRMGYYPFSVLCRDREFWFTVATLSVVSRHELAEQGIFGHDREFSIATEFFDPVSQQWSSVAIGLAWNGPFCVATRSSRSRQSLLALCLDMVFPCHDRLGCAWGFLS